MVISFLSTLNASRPFVHSHRLYYPGLTRYCARQNTSPAIHSRRYTCPARNRDNKATSRVFAAATSYRMPGTFGRTVVVDATAQQQATLIFLHGLGSSGEASSHIGRSLQGQLPHVKFVFPTAPLRSVAMSGGMQAPAWFDLPNNLEGLLRISRECYDKAGVADSVKYLSDIIQGEIFAGIPANRIVVAGFSQGGHLALKTALQFKQPLAACIALSTWSEPFQVAADVKAVPVFVGHGGRDQLVLPQLSSAIKPMLQQQGLTNIEYHMYPTAVHEVPAEEMAHLQTFLKKVLPQGPVQMPTREEIGSMSVKQLKDFLRQQGVDFRGLLEKSEFVEKAQALV